MDQDGNIPNVPIGRSLSDHQIDPMNGISRSGLDQIIQQENLLSGELLSDHVREDAEIRPHSNQVPSRFEIFLFG
jgi:hypothetical protein